MATASPACAAAACAGARSHEGHGNPGLVGALRIDYCLGFVVGLSCLFARALYLESHLESQQRAGGPAGPAHESVRSSTWRARRLAGPMATLAVAYAFAWPGLPGAISLAHYHSYGIRLPFRSRYVAFRLGTRARV